MISRTHLTRDERLDLVGAVIRGIVAGIVRIAIAWLLAHLGAS
jgi:hypothetical protein